VGLLLGGGRGKRERKEGKGWKTRGRKTTEERGSPKYFGVEPPWIFGLLVHLDIIYMYNLELRARSHEGNVLVISGLHKITGAF